jgi:hypothetical protein
MGRGTSPGPSHVGVGGLLSQSDFWQAIAGASVRRCQEGESNMRKVQRLFVLAAAALTGLAAASNGAVAGSGSGSGSATYTIVHIDDRQLPGGNVLSRDHYKGVMLANDASSPFNLANQDCLGSMVFSPAKGAPVEIGDVCDAVDKDGDVSWIWYHDAGDVHTWAFMGGTGKYEGITGSGTTAQLGGSADRLVISWEGNWTMK